MCIRLLVKISLLAPMKLFLIWRWCLWRLRSRGMWHRTVWYTEGNSADKTALFIFFYTSTKIHNITFRKVALFINILVFYLREENLAEVTHCPRHNARLTTHAVASRTRSPQDDVLEKSYAKTFKKYAQRVKSRPSVIYRALYSVSKACGSKVFIPKDSSLRF